MARKGQKFRKWTNEERLKFVLMCEEEHIPVRTSHERKSLYYYIRLNCLYATK